MNLNSNIKKVKPSATLAINELSNKLERQGKKIYKFGLGQSPFPVPKIIEKELQKMAKEFDSCLQTFLSVNQTTIITTAGLGGLISELIDLLSKNNASATLFCQGFATAVNNHAMSATLTAFIPGAPPVTVVGPIS